MKSNDKNRGRLEAMRHVLSLFDYTDKNHEVVGTPDPLVVGAASDVFEQGERQPAPRRAELSRTQQWMITTGC